MLAAFLSKIEEMTAANKKPIKLDDVSDVNETKYAIDGEIVTVESPPTVRQNSLDSISDLCDAIGRFSGDASKSAVWVQPHFVRVEIDEETRKVARDELTMSLSLNPAFEKIAKLEREWVSQKSAVDTFRHDLFACVVEPSSMIQSIRKLRFSTQSKETGEFTASSAALGRSVESQISGDIDLPEQFSIEFHPYPELHNEFPSLAVVVMCSLFTDAGRGMLKFAPLPGEIARCKREAAEAIKQRVAELSNVDTFLGR